MKKKNSSNGAHQPAKEAKAVTAYWERCLSPTTALVVIPGMQFPANKNNLDAVSFKDGKGSERHPFFSALKASGLVSAGLNGPRTELQLERVHDFCEWEEYLPEIAKAIEKHVAKGAKVNLVEKGAAAANRSDHIRGAFRSRRY